MISNLHLDSDNFDLTFVGVGPQRTGTSWLHHVLSLHPQLCFPQDVKETMFFDKHYRKGLQWYTSHFADCSFNKLNGEIAPTCFNSYTARNLIHQLNPRCKIIVNFREPVGRAFSLYNHFLKLGLVSGSFFEAVEQMPYIIDSGKYSLYTPKWLDLFGEENISFILLDDIASQPEVSLKNICNFLGIEEFDMPDEAHQKIGSRMMPRYRWLAKIGTKIAFWLRTHRFHKVVELGKKRGLKSLVYSGGEYNIIPLLQDEHLRLIEQYESDIKFVEELLGRDLSMWRQIN